MPKCKLCGARVAAGDAACPQCGARLGAAAPVPQASRRLAQSARPAPQPQQQQTPPQQAARPQYQQVQYVQIIQPPPAQAAAPSSAAGADADEDSLMDAFITGRTGAIHISYAYLHYKESFRRFRQGSLLQWNWASAILGPANLIYRRRPGWAFLLLLAGVAALFVLLPGVVVLPVAGGLLGDRLAYSRFRKVSRRAWDRYPGRAAEQLSFAAGRGGTNLGAAMSFAVAVAVAAAVLVFVGILYFWG